MSEPIRPFADLAAGYTVFHNVILDHVMPICKPNTWKILCVAIRQTTGWHRDEDQISLSQFMGKAGIQSRETAVDAIADAVEQGFLKRRPHGQGYVYWLNYEFELPASREIRPVLVGESDQQLVGKSDTQKKGKETERHFSPAERASSSTAPALSPAPENGKPVKPADWPYGDFRPTPDPDSGWPADTQPQIFTAPSGGTKASREAHFETCSMCQAMVDQASMRCRSCGHPIVWLNSLPYKHRVVKPWLAARADAKATERREGERAKLPPAVAYLFGRALEAPAVAGQVFFKPGEKGTLSALVDAHGEATFQRIVDECRAGGAYGRGLILHVLRRFEGGYLGERKATEESDEAFKKAHEDPEEMLRHMLGMPK